MDKVPDYNALKDQILNLKAAVEKLEESGKTIPAISRNVARIKASVKMLELNIVDPLEIEEIRETP